MGGVHSNIVQRAKLGIRVFLVVVVPVLPLVLFVLLVGINTTCKGSSSGQETTADLEPLLMLLSPVLNFFTLAFFWSVSLVSLVIMVLLVSVGSANKSSSSGEAGTDLELLLVSFSPVLDFFTLALFWSFSFLTVVFLVSVGSASKSSNSGNAGADLKLFLVLLVLKPALLLLSLVVGVFIAA